MSWKQFRVMVSSYFRPYMETGKIPRCRSGMRLPINIISKSGTRLVPPNPKMLPT